ncbi:hypothetical protein [Streptomyces chartreusis]
MGFHLHVFSAQVKAIEDMYVRGSSHQKRCQRVWRDWVAFDRQGFRLAHQASHVELGRCQVICATEALTVQYLCIVDAYGVLFDISRQEGHCR